LNEPDAVTPAATRSARVLHLRRRVRLARDLADHALGHDGLVLLADLEVRGDHPIAVAVARGAARLLVDPHELAALARPDEVQLDLAVLDAVGVLRADRPERRLAAPAGEPERGRRLDGLLLRRGLDGRAAAGPVRRGR